MTSLNPVLTCGYQITESLKTHRNIGRTEARETTISLLQQVGIPEPHKRIKEYPHQLSGGMRQRVMIAMALSCNPVLLIADEPTTALDVTIQAQILQIMSKLKQSHDMAVIFITHDLGVVSEIADMIIVLYAGKVVERGSKKDIIENAQHPYSIGLLESVPNMENEQEKLNVIPGTIPDPTSYTEGCRFYNRCNRHTEECKKQPSEFAVGPGHSVACFNYMKKP
jgi:oligopeptide/dipeptide ABC transporter ATP-binding protein